jgi:WD40 repeat protein
MLSRSNAKWALLVVPVAIVGFLWLRPRDQPRPFPNGAEPAGIAGPAAAIAYAPDGTVLCAAYSGMVQAYVPEKKRFRSMLVNRDDGGERSSAGFGGSGVFIQRLAVSADSKHVTAVVPQWPSLSVVFDLKKRRSLHSFAGPQSGVFDVSRDERWAVCGVQGGVLLVDLSQTKTLPKVATPPVPKRFRHHPIRVYGVTPSPSSASFSPDSRTLAVGFNSQVALFDVDGDFQVPRLQVDIKGRALPPQASDRAALRSANTFSDNRPLWLEWSPDGSKLAVLHSDQISILNRNLQTLVSAAVPRIGAPSNMLGPERANMAWTPDGEVLFSGGYQVRRWATADLKLEKIYAVSGPVAVSPDGKTLLTNNEARQGQKPYLLQWDVR